MQRYRGTARAPLLALVLVAVSAMPARAERLAVTDVRAEVDVADEAAAVSLLVRSALAEADRTLLGAPAGLTVRGAPAMLTKFGADHALLMDLSREGTGLRMTVVIAGATGEPDVSLVRAGDGDVSGLANGIVDHVTTVLKLKRGRISKASLGQLHPYVTAIRLRPTDPAAAARALAEANPLTVLSVPAVASALEGLPALLLTDRPLAVIAARAIGDVRELDALAAGTDPPAVAARAFAAIARADVTKADEAIRATTKRHGLIALARLEIASRRGRDQELAQGITEGLAGDQRSAVMAVSLTVLPEKLPKAIHRSLVAFSHKPGAASPGVVSRIGLAAAVLGVERPRSLALITVRELDDLEIAQLEPLIATGSDATTVRLRAEVAMRRSQGTEEVAINELLEVAPDDPRSHLYAGWLLMAQNRPREAAAEFGAAGQPRLRARALLAANELVPALTALGEPPTSPEEQVIGIRIALSEGKLDDAAAALERVEIAAPVSPTVHAVMIDLGNRRSAPPAPVSMRIVETALGKDAATPPPPAGRAIDLKASGSGSAESIPNAVDAATVSIDPTPLLALLDQVPGLLQLVDRKLVLVERSWDDPFYALRTADARPVRDGLVKLLSAPPYRLEIEIASLPIEEIDQSTMTGLSTRIPTVLVYHVAPDGSDAKVTLVLYQRGAQQAPQFDATISMPGVIGWNTYKLIPLVGVSSILVLLGVIWLSRALGSVTIRIEAAPDMADEVLCVMITKSPTRPPVPDLEAFHTKTKAAGAITKPRSATMISSGAEFQLPTGRWYVHVYGTFYRGNQLKRVPDSCTKMVELRRGDATEVSFTLTSKLAEVLVVIESQNRRGAEVWPNNSTHEKVYTSAAGEATIELPIGTHTLHIDVNGHRIERTVQVASAKNQRIAINVARELRFSDDPDLAPGTDENSKPTTLPGELTMDKPDTSPMGFEATHLTPRPAAADLPIVAFRPRPRAQTPVPGQLMLGRYKVLAELGRGAMGVVHRAMDEKLEREVAIKEMADDLRSNPEAMRLFAQEAKALAQLNHTNIVGMYDQITETDKVYMIMEFVDGQTLESLLAARKVLPWREAVAIIDQVCSALAYAHARRVIHRDIKPANIFVMKDRTAKLGDFGLARVMREVTIRRTEIRGTPMYMAPEQITGTDVDHRTDLYAIGCTLYELVCGRPPFIDGDIMYAQMHTPPLSPKELCPDLPAPLDELILSLIAKSADDRPGSANEVRAVFGTLRG